MLKKKKKKTDRFLDQIWFDFFNGLTHELAWHVTDVKHWISTLTMWWKEIGMKKIISNPQLICTWRISVLTHNAVQLQWSSGIRLFCLKLSFCKGWHFPKAQDEGAVDAAFLCCHAAATRGSGVHWVFFSRVQSSAVADVFLFIYRWKVFFLNMKTEN